MYGDAFVADAAARHGSYDANLMATLTEFSGLTWSPGGSSNARSSVRLWKKSSRREEESKTRF